MTHNQNLSQVKQAKRRIPARVILSAFILCWAVFTISGHIVSGASAPLATQSTIAQSTIPDRCSNSNAVTDPEPAGLVADCNALLAAKDTLRGTASLNWSPQRPIAQWLGVTVSSSRVTRLDLNNHGLTGSIPMVLSELSNLQTLDLGGGNQLTGSIPAALSRLLQLQNLDLSENQLEGGIPATLGNLSKLQTLHLWDNDLTGSIPAALGSLSKLQYLYLHANDLTGNIPAQLGNLSKLQRLDLSSNDLTGTIPVALGSLSKLTTLFLGANDLTGNIPAQLGSLSNLQGLTLSGNDLTGSIPAQLGSLSKLEYLYLGGNQLSGCIPSALSSVATNDLSDLRLPFCTIATPTATSSGSVATATPTPTPTASSTSSCANSVAVPDPEPAGLVADCNVLLAAKDTLRGTASLNWSTTTPINQWQGITVHKSRVTWLRLRQSTLTGRIPAVLGSLSNLQWLNLASNHLTGTIPVELGNLSNLNQLWLAGNQLSGCIPSALSSVPQNDLSNLGLPFCATDTSSATTTPTATPTSVSACANSVAVPDPESAGLVADCNVLLAAKDTLRGTASLNWSTTSLINAWEGILVSNSRVTRLSLRGRRLTGNIPAVLGNLSQLQVLNLRDNQLVGNIPVELGSLSNLQKLNLRDNRLTGPIPAALGNLSQLQWLNLASNRLTGSIPAQLGNLSRLQTLTLRNNQLTGTIPATLGNLSHLRTLTLHNNQLCGDIPQALLNLPNLNLDIRGRTLPACSGTSATATPTAISVATATSIATPTPIATATPTATPTHTVTPSPTATPTPNTPVCVNEPCTPPQNPGPGGGTSATATPTAMSVATATLTLTATPTVTHTHTVTPSPTPTLTATPTTVIAGPGTGGGSGGGPTSRPGPTNVNSTVSLTASTSTIPLTGQSCISVQVAQADNLGAFDFTLSFPATRLAGASASLGPFLGSTDRTVSAVTPNISAGSLTFGAYSAGSQDGPEGSGTLASVCFEPRTTGSAKIAFRNLQITDINGQVLQVRSQGTSFTITNSCFWADIDCDGDVDIVDIQRVAGKWNTRRGHNDFEARYDLDNDGDIDIIDIQRVASRFGHSLSDNPARNVDVASSQAAGDISLQLSPALLQLTPSQTGRIFLDASNAQALAALQAKLTYDPTLIRIESIRLTDWLGSTGRTVNMLGPQIDNRQGIATFAAFSTGTQPGVSGSGSLAILEVKALGVGESDLAINDSQATTPDASPLSVTDVDAVVQVRPMEMLYLPFVRR